MPKMIFALEEHKDHGSEGWRPVHQHNFDPYGAMAVAHDIMEHFPDSTDDASDEFQALGACWWIRGDSGYWHDKTPMNPHPANHISSDFTDIYSRVQEGAVNFRVPTRFTRVDDSTEEDIASTVEKARKELMYLETNGERLTPEEFEMRRSHVNTFCIHAQEWMRRGYKRAAKRFAKHSNYDMCELFKDIEREVERVEVMVSRTFGDLAEGARMGNVRMTLHVNFTQRTVRSEVEGIDE